jgi:hypothetical protein
VATCMWMAPHVIRLTTITLRHFDAGERAPSTTPKPDSCSAAKDVRGYRRRALE